MALKARVLIPAGALVDRFGGRRVLVVGGIVNGIGLLLAGLGVFAVRFHNYFAAGATSAGARLDYASSSATDYIYSTYHKTH
jgi:nitrate/nitrite transporter NarK